jgi:hypothetical protein
MSAQQIGQKSCSEAVQPEQKTPKAALKLTIKIIDARVATAVSKYGGTCQNAELPAANPAVSYY